MVLQRMTEFPPLKVKSQECHFRTGFQDYPVPTRSEISTPATTRIHGNRHQIRNETVLLIPAQILRKSTSDQGFWPAKPLRSALQAHFPWRRGCVRTKNKETTNGQDRCQKHATSPAPTRLRSRNRATERRGREGGWCGKGDFRTSTCETRSASSGANLLGLDAGQFAFGCRGVDPWRDWASRFVPQTRVRVGCCVRKG